MKKLKTDAAQFVSRGIKPHKIIVETFLDMAMQDLKAGYGKLHVGQLVKYSHAPTVIESARNKMAGKIVAIRAAFQLPIPLPGAAKQMKMIPLRPDEVFLLVRGMDESVHIGTANDFVTA